MRSALLVTLLGLLIVGVAVADYDTRKNEMLQVWDRYQAGYTLSDADMELLKEFQMPLEQGETPVIDEAGGPDAFGYIYRDSQEGDGPTFDWVDITATGTNIAGDLFDDDHSGPYPIGFSFPFYGTTYTDFYMQSNGVISFFDSYVSLGNSNMPTTNYGAMIAWFWDDLDPNQGQNGESIFYETMTINNMNALVIEFFEYDEYPDDPAAYDITAEVILFEDGTIKMQYDEIMPAMDINGETIGIQDDTGTIGLEVSYNSTPANYPFNDLAIEFAVLPGDANMMGTVTDMVTGDLIPGATVATNFASTSTDGSGYYELLEIYSGDVSVDVSATGYETYSTTITLDPGDNTYDFELVPMYVIDIEPLQGTTIAPNGGTFTYSAELINPTPFPSLMDGWTWVVMPTGGTYGPVLNQTLNVQSGSSFVPQLAMQVPGMAPGGIYAYRAALGNFPNTILAEDVFYFYKLGPGPQGASSDFDFEATPWDVAMNGAATVVELPQQFEVAKVYPNPFNPTATVKVSLPDAAELSVQVFNITGQRVAELANGKYSAGQHSLTIDGSQLASGVYFVHTSVPGQINDIQKVTLMK